MHETPEISDIVEWLKIHRPLGLFSDDFKIRDIDPKPWSGHFNYLVETGGSRMVLRFKGPEWGGVDGVAKEYQILKFVENYQVGPKVFWETGDFFGESALLMEYIKGEMFEPLSFSADDQIWQDIAVFIANINKINFLPTDLPFEEPMTSFIKSKKAWKDRIAFILDCREAHVCGTELLSFLPAVESVLNKYDILLSKVLAGNNGAFIFESAHSSHLISSVNGFRFFNWEQVSYGDPSFTLAVFLSGLKERPDFQIIKKNMTMAYLDKHPIGDFEILLENRLTERQVANAIYRIYAKVKKDATLFEDWPLQLDIIKNIIDRNA